MEELLEEQKENLREDYEEVLEMSDRIRNDVQMNFIKKALLNRELRELQLRKMHPDRYSNSVPNYDEIMDRMIRNTKRKLESD